MAQYQMLLVPSRMATLARPLQTAPVTFQFVKDIYKTVNFKTSYSDEEKEGILHKLNKLSEADLHSYIRWLLLAHLLSC